MPSCEGPLRAQIYRKVCFYEQKYDFWLVRVPFALSFVTLSRFTKNHVSITKTSDFSPLGPLRAQQGLFTRAPELIKIGNF